MRNPRFLLKPSRTGALCATLLGMACAASARAEDPIHLFYGDIGAGTSPLDAGLRELRVIGGVQFTSTASLEVSTAKYFVRRPTAQTAELSDARNYRINGRYLTPDFLGVTPFITAGVGQTHSSAELGLARIRTTGFAYGVGIQKVLFERLQVRLEWQDLDAAAPAAVHPAMVGLSVGTRF